MSLVRVNDLLKHATEHRYGVPAINIFNYESILWAVRAAEREKLPIIIQFFPGFETHIAAKYVSYITKDLAEKASVPVAVHLDHSRTAEIALAGIRDGFPSVMVDGSAKSFDENVEMTKAVVQTARVFGVDVEAELGHVGIGSKLEDFTNADLFTKVDEAVKFVELTGCDSLAVAVGNAHGAYVKTPSLAFDRIAELRAALDIPLVMHGGSDIPDDQLQKSVQLGMSKFNIATEYDRSYYNLTKELYEAGLPRTSGFAGIKGIEEKMMNFVGAKLQLLNPNHFSL